jgi:hypothetical protein
MAQSPIQTKSSPATIVKAVRHDEKHGALAHGEARVVWDARFLS